MTTDLGLLVLKAAASCCHLPPLSSCPSCLNYILPSYPKIPTFLFLIPVQPILVFHFVPHLYKDDIWDWIKGDVYVSVCIEGCIQRGGRTGMSANVRISGRQDLPLDIFQNEIWHRCLYSGYITKLGPSSLEPNGGCLRFLHTLLSLWRLQEEHDLISCGSSYRPGRTFFSSILWFFRKWKRVWLKWNLVWKVLSRVKFILILASLKT